MSKELETISKAVLHSQHTQDEVNATNNLGLFYSELMAKLKIKADSTVYTNISGGVALSPQHAIDCLKDGVRTSRFLKGIFKAISQSLEKNKGETLEILYAGCGPLATLIVPLLPHFKSEQLRITLLDIHDESIESCKKIIEHLQLSDFFVDFKTCDATKYSHPVKIDLLITETMDKGLIREPQVSISEHLCQQLSARGILVPKQISLHMGTAVFSDLPTYKTSFQVENASTLVKYEQFLFSANMSSKISTEGFKSGIITIPENRDSAPDICIFTEIEIFDGVFMKACDALITDPICIGNTGVIEASHYQLNYTTKPSPSWSIIQKSGTE